MNVKIKSYNSLAVFSDVASFGSFTAAANHLHLSKGAVSHQINKLEGELGFALFTREARGIALTDHGERLLAATRLAFADINRCVADVQLQLQMQARETARRQMQLQAALADRVSLTVGLTTYFASRWLSQRLMNFPHQYRDIRLRLEPTSGVVDIGDHDIDLLIRWGNGDWQDLNSELLFSSRVYPTACPDIADAVRRRGLADVISNSTLLHDCDDSVAWEQWHELAGIAYSRTQADLVIPDPNVRVQAVIDGQGLALNDQLVQAEVASGKLALVSSIALPDVGYYLVYPGEALSSEPLASFCDWIRHEAALPDNNDSLVKHRS